MYEGGVELFTFPVSFEIWNIYLSKFTKRYVSTRIPPPLRSYGTHSIAFVQILGWYEAGAHPRSVRAGFREMSSQVVQTHIPHVRQARGRTRLS